MSAAASVTGAKLADFAVLAAPGMSATEAGVARAIAHALRLAGFVVEQADRAARARLLVGDLEHVMARVAAVDAAAGAPTIVVPLVRSTGERAGWSDIARRVTALWTTTPDLQRNLASDGVAASWIGASSQLGAIRHRSRRALRLRDEDYVFVAVEPPGGATAAMTAVERLWTRLRDEPATRYAKTSLLVSVADDRQKQRWTRFAAELRSDAIVVHRRTADPLDLASLLATADCELFCDAGPGFPWSASCTLFAGKPVLALAELSAEPFGGGALPNLHRVAGDTELLEHVRRLLVRPAGEREAGSAGARRMLLQCSARALAVRITAALRTVSLWDDLAAGEAP